MKTESKFKKLGRVNGELLFAFISLSIGEKIRKSYISNFLGELKSYSFRPHYVGEERHEGCRSWIAELPNRQVDYTSASNLAIKVKADLDGLQQKRHATNYYNGLLEAFVNEH